MTFSRRPLLVALVPVVFLACTAPSGDEEPMESASAALGGDVAIQPGAPLVMGTNYPIFAGQAGPAAPPGHCTLNFVFKRTVIINKVFATKKYIGTAGECVAVGQRAKSPTIGEFGTVVFRQSNANGPFGLIEIDADKGAHVSSVVRGWGSAPTGHTTSAQTNPNDRIFGHGFPVGLLGDIGVSRHGVLTNLAGATVEDTATGYVPAEPLFVDRGSPVIHVATGKALGMSNEYYWPVSGMTVEGILNLLHANGFSGIALAP